MSLVLTAAPAVEPVSLAEAKAHLRLDGVIEDAFVTSLILTSRLHVEAALGLALVAQNWTWIIDAWPTGLGIALPMRPVRSIEAIRLRSIDGTASQLPPSSYVLDGTGHPARLLPPSTRWPAPARNVQGIEIDFTAGFGPAASDVPQPIRQALLMLIAHWFENREASAMAAGAASPQRIPSAVSELLMPYRSARL